MAQFRNYDIQDREKLCNLGKALSSPIRLELLQLLYDRNMIIGEIAKELDLPASSTAFHLKILEQAGLIRMEELPGTRGGMKLCTMAADHIIVDLVKRNVDVGEVYSVEMPVSAYSSCDISPTCGLMATDGIIGNEDLAYWFYRPERLKAGMLWSASGYVEYQFANGVPGNRMARQLSVSAELCSEAPGYCESWKSDITLWINGKDCGTANLQGDFGARRGRLNPPSVPNGYSQYGILTTWVVRNDGCYLNGIRVSAATLSEIWDSQSPYITVRLGNSPNAMHTGGFNLFGRNFGDYQQDILLNIEY